MMSAMDLDRAAPLAFASLIAVIQPCAALASEARLEPAEIRYLGRFKLPAPSGTAPSETWSWGVRGLTLVPDCLGERDPSPDDGYPGCAGAFGHDHAGLFGVFDLVPPSRRPPGNRARQVVPFYSIGETLPAKAVRQLGQARYWDVLYDRGPEHCRLWWSFGSWFIEIADDPPFLGVSSCDPKRPEPRGLWGFGKRKGRIETDPFHSAKFYRLLSRVPRDLAEAEFGGSEMMLGGTYDGGTRGGSQGPSAYVRPLRVPERDPEQDLVALLWYRHTAYVKWYDKPEMSGGAMRHWTGAETHGVEWVSSSAGRAAAVMWETPTVNPEDYPCSDSTAYRDNDPTTPEPCKVPVCWYGLMRCEEGKGHAEFQQPSFWEDTSTGKPMPKDCRLQTGGDFTGPHCLSKRPFILLYDISELAAVYRGEKEHNEPQPYAAVPLEAYFRSSSAMGTTYDAEAQRLYLSEGGDHPIVHVFAIGGEEPSAASRSGTAER